MPVSQDVFGNPTYKSFSEVTERYDVLDREKAAIQLRLDAIDEELKHLGHVAFSKLRETGAERVRSGHFEVKIESKRAYKALSWEDFYSWVQSTGRFDTLHRRLSVTVLDDICSTEGTPPGIEKTEYSDVKFKRVSKANTANTAHKGVTA